MMRFLLTLVFIGFGVGCSTPKSTPEAKTAEGSLACGSTFEAKVGAMFSVSLNANPSTGYSWYQTEESKAVAAQEGEGRYKATSSDPNIVGGGGTLTMTFKVLKSGTFTTEYRRVWEKDTPAVETCRITVKAQ